MKRHWLVVVLSLMLVLGSTGALGAEEGLPVPDATAALGDSITRAFHSSCGLLNDCPEESWSTGSAVESHVVRLSALGGSAVRGDNLAVTGAVAADLASQASNIASDVDYVTILIGANDACTDTVAQMTPVSEFQSSITAALDTIGLRAPDAAVYIASIPDLYRLWEVGKNSGSARFAWWLYGICQSMLESPRSTREADVDRRLTVRERVINYNAALEQECLAYPGTCHYDGGAVFGYPFELSHLSTIDYFHPNTAGQEILALVTWEAGYTWSSGEPTNQPPMADAGPDQTVMADESGRASVTLNGAGSTDPDGTINHYSWAEGGTEIATGESATVALGVAIHAITLTVTDDDQATATDEVEITVLPYEPPPTTPEIHVGDLDGSTVIGRRGRWTATVTITVHDAGGSAVGGVLVEGVWSDGAKGGGSCTTDGEGKCSVGKSNIKADVPSVRFGVTDVSLQGFIYDSSANHDPDSDSDGTAIVVTQ
jgi:lysophospholipase L1-like esterase